MRFATIKRTDMAGIVHCYLDGETIKVFRHPGGWSVQSSEGLLRDAGFDQFAQLEPLLETLKSKGIERLLVEP